MKGISRIELTVGWPWTFGGLMLGFVTDPMLSSYNISNRWSSEHTSRSLAVDGSTQRLTDLGSDGTVNDEPSLHWRSISRRDAWRNQRSDGLASLTFDVVFKDDLFFILALQWSVFRQAFRSFLFRFSCLPNQSATAHFRFTRHNNGLETRLMSRKRREDKTRVNEPFGLGRRISVDRSFE